MSQTVTVEPPSKEAGTASERTFATSLDAVPAAAAAAPRPVRPLPAARPIESSYRLYGELAIYSGTAHPDLAQSVANYLSVPLGGVDIFQFRNTNTFVRLHQSVRGKDVFLIQPTSPPTNDNLMELLIFIDTLRRDSAGRITAVIPYYGYGRTDKKDQPRVPITARLVADLITVAGADRFLTFDLHAGQIQGFFTIPTDELPTVGLFVDYFKRLLPTDREMVVVSPDMGGVRRARNLAERLNLPIAIIEKRRARNGSETQMVSVIGEVKGKNVIIADDEIDTAGTLCDAARFLRQVGACELMACATHPILSKPAAKRIEKSDLTRLVVTDTVPIEKHKLKRIGERLEILSVGTLLGDVISRIHTGQSVGELFDE